MSPRGAEFPDASDQPVEVSYSPARDGEPDPGEVVWTWVPFEDDPRQGKDRPAVVIGTDGDELGVIPLTTKVRHGRDGTDGDERIKIGPGPWDPAGRDSYAKLEYIMRVRPDAIRRVGAALDKQRFDRLVAEAQRLHPGDVHTFLTNSTRIARTRPAK